MMESRLEGVWRSYKAFYFSGKAEQHSETKFIEIAVDAQGAFVLRDAQNSRKPTVYAAGQWRVELLKRRQYIYLGKRQAYELLTFEREDLVLADVVKGEKLFFAKMPGWKQRIKPTPPSVRHIRSNKKTEEY